jgi:diacylglycerol kinase (ATP)
MAKRARLIYNPSSGREEMKKRLPEILQQLERGGIETSTHATIGEGDATLAAAEAVERGFDIIIAAGGDGTIYEVINGMAEKEYRPQLGIIPLILHGRLIFLAALRVLLMLSCSRTRDI